MIVYRSTKREFLTDASSGIEDKVRAQVYKKLFIDIKPGSGEYESWKNSLGNAMYHVLNTPQIPDDAGIAIEYAIPGTKNRVDIMITGEDAQGKETVVIIELKQWTQIERTEKDAMVRTRFRSGMSEELHPSYQAYSYASLLYDFNAVVYQDDIGLQPCAYLHNHVDEDVILHDAYKSYIEKAPAFCKGDKEKLQAFIAQYVRYGEKKNTLYRIDNGEIRPSKKLIDKLLGMFEGKPEFVMIDQQKIVFENALERARYATVHNDKQVIIVEGGPGTGKTVVAINLLVAAIAESLNARYITKNAAPRAVFESILSGKKTKSEIAALFSGSGAFITTPENLFDFLIVDEAHRLTEKSGFMGTDGTNQIMEIIAATKCSIFFVDEDQRVTWNDIGGRKAIEVWAEELGAETLYLKLESQFRCGGSDGFLAWLDNTLQIKETANKTMEGIEYDFRVMSSPNELQEWIVEKNKEKNSARTVAGYCWDWKSKSDASVKDIVIPEYDFSMQWNLNTDGSLWIIQPKSVEQVGCIHTCQGLEVEYIGVIVGSDLVVRDGQVVVDPSKRAKTDKALKGYKRDLVVDPVEATSKVKAIIKNTYRTLMTRGQKGCAVYFVDKETEVYFRERIGK